MRKRFAAFLLTVMAMAVPAHAWSQPDTEPVRAKGCVVIEQSTGRILYAHNAHDRLPMASTTKIMTAWLTLEQPQLDEWFTVNSRAVQVEGSSMGLQEGDEVTLRALVHGMLLPSGNDAANAAAVRIAGNVPAFVELMNRRAQEIGLENTNFITASGLDAPDHYSTAYDMAILMAYAMQEPEFARITSMQEAKLEFGNPPYTRWLKNNNKLLSLYNGCIGGKTGYTNAAYRCLVSAAERDGVTLICVTLNCADDWTIHSKLYDRYFAQLQAEDFTPQAELKIPVIGGSVPQVQGVCMEQPIVPLKDGEAEQVESRLTLHPMEFAPICRGQYLGEYVLLLNGEEIFSTPVLAGEDIIATTQPKEEKSLWERIKAFTKEIF